VAVHVEVALAACQDSPHTPTARLRDAPQVATAFTHPKAVPPAAPSQHGLRTQQRATDHAPTVVSTQGDEAADGSAQRFSRYP
jgi:hypothetical protein